MSYHKIFLIYFLVFSLSILQGCKILSENTNSDRDGDNTGIGEEKGDESEIETDAVSTEVYSPGDDPLNGQNAYNTGLLEDPKLDFSVKNSIKLAEAKVSVSGGVIWIKDSQNLLYGSTITIPAGAFTEPTTITIFQVETIKSGFPFKPISPAIKMETDTGKDPTSYVDITIPYSTIIHEQYDLSKIDPSSIDNIDDASSSLENKSKESASTGFIIFKSNIGEDYATEGLIVKLNSESTDLDKNAIFSQGIISFRAIKWGTYQFGQRQFQYDISSYKVTSSNCFPDSVGDVDTSEYEQIQLLVHDDNSDNSAENQGDSSNVKLGDSFRVPLGSFSYYYYGEPTNYDVTDFEVKYITGKISDSYSIDIDYINHGIFKINGTINGVPKYGWESTNNSETEFIWQPINNLCGDQLSHYYYSSVKPAHDSLCYLATYTTLPSTDPESAGTYYYSLYNTISDDSYVDINLDGISFKITREFTFKGDFPSRGHAVKWASLPDITDGCTHTIEAVYSGPQFSNQ